MNSLPSTLEIDINSINNYNDVRKRTYFLSNVSTRSMSIVSQASSLPYHERMLINNNLPDKEIIEPIDSSQLSYSGNSQERNCNSMATDPVFPKSPNMLQIRHWPAISTIVNMLVMMMSSTYNYYTILISLWNLNCGMVTLVTFLFITSWNISHLMPATSRSLLFTWKTRKLTQQSQIMSKSYKIWVKLLENSFPLSIIQDGICLSATPTIISLDRRYHIITP